MSPQIYLEFENSKENRGSMGSREQIFLVLWDQNLNYLALTPNAGPTQTHAWCHWTPFDLLDHVDHVFLEGTFVVFRSILQRCEEYKPFSQMCYKVETRFCDLNKRWAKKITRYEKRQNHPIFKFLKQVPWKPSRLTGRTQNVVLGTKNIKIGSTWPKLALGMSKSPYFLGKTKWARKG